MGGTPSINPYGWLMIVNYTGIYDSMTRCDEHCVMIMMDKMSGWWFGT
jgi:hypothetical protein